MISELENGFRISIVSRVRKTVNGKIAVTCVRRVSGHVFILTAHGRLCGYNIRVSDDVKTAVSGNYALKRCIKALRSPLFDRPDQTAKNDIIKTGTGPKRTDVLSTVNQ